MTLKQKTLSLFSLAAFVLFLSLFIFQEYRSTNQRLENIFIVLEEIKGRADEIERKIIDPEPDTEAVKRIIASVPSLMSQLQQELLAPTKPAKLIDLEIVFVKIHRLMDQVQKGEVVGPPLRFQIRQEIKQISRSIGGLRDLANEKIHSLRHRAELMILMLSLVLFASLLGMIAFVFGTVVRPILYLTQQIDQVRQGDREAIKPSARGDEIGRLSEFVRQAINKISEKNKALEREVKVRIEMEEKLRQSTSTLENVLNNSNPICITNLDFEIIKANRAYYEIWPKRSQEGTVLKCYQSRPGPFCHSDSCPLQQILEGREVVTQDSIKRTSAGLRLHFITNSRPFRGEDGTLLGIVESFQDITVRKEAEAALLEERDKLEIALAEVKTLQGFIPICASCKAIRDDQGCWNKLEEYIRKHSDAQFSHGICPKCAKTLYPEVCSLEGSLVSSPEARSESGSSLYV